MATRKTPSKTTKPALQEADEAAGDSAEANVAPTDREPMLRKKELFDRVVEATGAKRKDVKLIVEATLDALGKALASGEGLALPPLGKARVNRQKDLASGEMLMVKLRRGGAGGGQSEAANEALEEAAE